MKQKIVFKGVSYTYASDKMPVQKDFFWHCHNRYELLCIVEGEGEYIIEDKHYKLKPGAVFAVPPKNYHKINIVDNSAYERFVLSFSSDIIFENNLQLLEPLNSGMPDTGHYFPPNAFSSSPEGLFKRLKAYASLPEREKIFMTKLVTNEIITLLYTAYDNKKRLLKVNENSIVDKVCSFVDENFEKKLTLDEIAEHFFVSKYYLCHAFKSAVGVSLMKYIAQKRILKASHLIGNGTAASKAAYICGYADYSSFYRAYKKHAGISPKTSQSNL